MELKDDIKEIISEIEKKGDVKAVFGDPIREGGLTIIPVANMSISGGGGGGGMGDEKMDTSEEGKESSGKWPKMKGKGFGIGYAKKAQPVGYIKIEDNNAVFIPITDWNKIIPVAVGVVGLGAIMVIRMMMKKSKCHKYHEKYPT